MSAIDDLIAQVLEPRLREQLKREWAEAQKTKKFGLVFDRHLPELVPIPKARPRRGDLVARKGGSLTDLWRVRRLSGGMAHCVRPEGTPGAGDPWDLELDELVVVRRFGEPIFPALTPVDQVQNGPADAPWHCLIEADNFHALQLLGYLYAGKVDCIYIDPPYNTGARDWKYNNDYVDGNDAWRHSKWLSFMERRLRLAKGLLNPQASVLIVTIDEKEYLRLGLLLEQLFPDGRIQMVSSVINPKGAARSSAFGRTDEYIFFVMFGSAAPAAISLGREWKITEDRRAGSLRWAELLRAGSNTRRADSPNQFYPVFVALGPDGPSFHSVGDTYFGTSRHEVEAPDGCATIWPIRSDGTEGNWQISAASLRDAIEKGYAKLGSWRGCNTAITYLKKGEQAKVGAGVFPVIGQRQDNSIIVDDSDYRPVFIPGTQWRIASHNAEQGGTNLQKLLIPNRRFPFPKSLYAVEDALRFFVGQKRESIILDFFSGSGTTAHAVMRLNRQDGGSRQCISVTNNEVGADEQKALSEQGLAPGDPDWEKWGICNCITWPRLVAAITGKTPDGQPIKGDYKFTDEFPIADGFPANLAYFKLEFLDKDRVALKRAFREILPLLWLKAGAIGPRPEFMPTRDQGEAEPAFFAPPANPFAVLLDEGSLKALLGALADRSGLKCLFIVTDSEDAFKELSAEAAGALRPTSPGLETVQLYRDYLDNFLINTDRILGDGPTSTNGAVSR